MEKILLGADESPAGLAAADWAARRAAKLGLGLDLVRTCPESWLFPNHEDYEHAVKRAEAVLRRATARLKQDFPALEVQTTQLSGEPAQILRDLSAEATMVVVGTDKRPNERGEGIGSISLQTAIISHCPVAIIPADTSGNRSDVVVGVDGSADSMAAADWAAHEASRMGAAVVAVYAVGGIPTPGEATAPVDETVKEAQQVLDLARRFLADRYPDLSVRTILDSERTAATALVEAALTARLLVIGCKGRGAQRVLVGSVAQHVLLNVPCPTLVTRPVAVSGQTSSAHPRGLHVHGAEGPETGRSDAGAEGAKSIENGG